MPLLSLASAHQRGASDELKLTLAGVLCLVPADPGGCLCSDHVDQRVRPGDVHHHHHCGVHCEGAERKIQSQAACSDSHRGDRGECCSPSSLFLRARGSGFEGFKFSFPFFFPQTVIACGVSYGFNFNKIFNVSIIGKMIRG